VTNDDLVIVDKNGGLNNTATYIGMIPQKRIGIVVLSNCGGEPATRIGRQIMLALARSNAVASDDAAKAIEPTGRADPTCVTRGLRHASRIYPTCALEMPEIG
jgi:hypothetical protein